jgi:hypothetical protein
MQIRVKLGVHVDALVSLFNITDILNVKFSFYTNYSARKEQSKNVKNDDHSVPTISLNFSILQIAKFLDSPV